MSTRFGSILWQAKLPIIMALVVVVLVVVTLRANEQRQCRQVCLKEGFAGAAWSKPLIGDGQCDCVTRDGKQVPAPR
jgi:ubiquinone biosynthesis protein Coq4